jgi:AcrR family transcriptional regulator
MGGEKSSTRISRESGSELLIEAVIELARTTPVARLTVRDIASTAGLQTMQLKRYFGSRNELLVAVTNVLMKRIMDPLFELALPQIFPLLQKNEDVALRLRIVNHLLDEGVDPKSFENDRDIYLRIAERIAEVNNVGKRTARTYALLIQLVLQGNHLMGDVNGLTARQRKDIFDLLVVLGAGLKPSETALGW